MSNLLTNSFDFHLPPGLIAQQPSDQRTHSRLLHVNKESIEHHLFKDIVDIAPEGSVFVVNNSKVLKARIFAKTEFGGKIEIFLTEQMTEKNHWKVLGRPNKKLTLGKKIFFEDGCSAEVVKTATSESQTELKFHLGNGQDFYDWLDTNGNVPLPPYIKRKDGTSQSDDERYQTVFAKHFGSVAAPTAGLHFSSELMEKMRRKNIKFVDVCLHVGLGTFLPVQADDPKEHNMHFERYEIPDATFQTIKSCLQIRSPIYAVGSTSFRAIESFHTISNGFSDSSLCNEPQKTNLFVYPKNKNDIYKPKVFSGIQTNFHLPKSTLFMLICALVGIDRAQKAYQSAIDEKYRFYSYGDCCFFEF